MRLQLLNKSGIIANRSVGGRLFLDWQRCIATWQPTVSLVGFATWKRCGRGGEINLGIIAAYEEMRFFFSPPSPFLYLVLQIIADYLRLACIT